MDPIPIILIVALLVIVVIYYRILNAIRRDIKEELKNLRNLYIFGQEVIVRNEAGTPPHASLVAKLQIVGI